MNNQDRRRALVEAGTRAADDLVVRLDASKAEGQRLIEAITQRRPTLASNPLVLSVRRRDADHLPPSTAQLQALGQMLARIEREDQRPA
jgi:hypothetical protein